MRDANAGLCPAAGREAGGLAEKRGRSRGLGFGPESGAEAGSSAGGWRAGTGEDCNPGGLGLWRRGVHTLTTHPTQGGDRPQHLARRKTKMLPCCLNSLAFFYFTIPPDSFTLFLLPSFSLFSYFVFEQLTTET